MCVYVFVCVCRFVFVFVPHFVNGVIYIVDFVNHNLIISFIVFENDGPSLVCTQNIFYTLW